MKVSTPPVVYYDNSEMIQSVDFRFSASTYLLATGSVQNELRLWRLKVDDDDLTVQVEYSAEMKNNCPINVVRFSADGNWLASGDVQGNVILWCERNDDDASAEGGDRGWKMGKTFSCVMPGSDSVISDVTDLSWSMTEEKLVSASLNGTLMLWKTSSSGPLAIFKCSDTLPMGIAYSPMHDVLVCLCEGGSMRAYNTATVNHKPMVLRQSMLPVNADKSMRMVPLFVGTNYNVMKRRPAVSADGKVLVCPSGLMPMESVGSVHVSYVFLIPNVKVPHVILPTDDYTLVVRFCPIAFRLNTDTPLIRLPYRYVFGVLQRRKVLLYDTEQYTPIGGMSNFHYANLTDMSWSSDGRVLAVSSVDGYLSYCVFGPGELGTPANLSEPVKSTVEEKTAPENNTLMQYFSPMGKRKMDELCSPNQAIASLVDDNQAQRRPQKRKIAPAKIDDD